MKKTLTLLALGALVLVPSASAHVTVNPNEVPADSFSRFAIRVPTETAERGHDQGRREAAEGPVLRRLPAKAGLEADDHDGEARPAGRRLR